MTETSLLDKGILVIGTTPRMRLASLLLAAAIVEGGFSLSANPIRDFAAMGEALCRKQPRENQTQKKPRPPKKLGRERPKPCGRKNTYGR